MTVWQLIRKRTKEGWEFQCGRHVQGFCGYWACFLPNEGADECDECDESRVDWESSGHAWTIKMAIRIADRIAQGVDVTIPDISEFVRGKLT